MRVPRSGPVLTRWSLRLAAAGAVLGLMIAGPARAGERVDLALALVADVSRSINSEEYTLQKRGYEAAFRNEKVIQAMGSGPAGGVAVAYIEFAGAGEAAKVVDWTIIRDAESAAVFADRLAGSPRSAAGRTSISAGIDLAVNALAVLPLDADRRVIDVSGDGTNNSGRSADQARDEALSRGIVINGLAIHNNDADDGYFRQHVQPPGGLAQWYRENVTGGAGSFVIEVRDFQSFGEALIQKLLTEIAAVEAPSRHAAGPDAPRGNLTVFRALPVAGGREAGR